MGNSTSKLEQSCEKIICFGNNILYQQKLSQKVTQYYKFACFKFALCYMVYPDRNSAFTCAKIKTGFKSSKDRKKTI